MKTLPQKFNQAAAKTIRRAAIAKFSLLALMLFASINSAWSDDTDIYTGLDESSCSASSDVYRFLFIVDNSGSMNNNEFSTSKESVDATITAVLSSGLSGVKVGVMQYGTLSEPVVTWNGFKVVWTWPNIQHGYHATVPFTDDLATATNWTRQYGRGSPRPNWTEDHLPASLAEARIDQIYDPGMPFYIEDATNVQVVFFTDARRGNEALSCCSEMVAVPGKPASMSGRSLPGFGEYNEFKNGELLKNSKGEKISAQFTVLNTYHRDDAKGAAAAIASVGGEWVGDVEENSGDPEGSQTKPRRFISASFNDPNLADKLVALVEEVIEEIKSQAFTQAAPAVSVNAFNRVLNRSELYYSFYTPTPSPRWDGNLKGFSIGADGVIRDKGGADAVDPATGTISPSSLSFWSEGDYDECSSAAADAQLGGCTESSDGSEAKVGGFRDGLTDKRVVYTQADVTNPSIFTTDGDYFSSGVMQIKADSGIDPKLLGTKTKLSVPINELDLEFSSAGTSFWYSESINQLNYRDRFSNTNKWTALANSEYFGGGLGANLNKSFQFDFTLNKLGGVGMDGRDNIIIGIQAGNDEAFDDERQVTFGVEFQSNGKLRTQVNDSFERVSLDDYSEGDKFSIKVEPGTDGKIKATLLRNGSSFQTTNDLMAQSDVVLSSGTDFRAVALGYESFRTGTFNTVKFRELELLQDDIGSWVNTGDITREHLLAWLTGPDVLNENLFKDAGDGNQFVADSLHSQPRVITYGGTEDNPIDVLFHTSNLGTMHAINPADGTEHWAYIPPELMDNPLAYMRNDDTIAGHTYGLDGAMTTWTIRDPGTSTPLRVFQYLGQRRGGKAIYAFNATNAAKGISGFSLPSGANHCGVIGDGNASDPICQLFPPIIGGTDVNSTPGFEMLGQTWGKPTRIVINTSDASFCGTEPICKRDVLLFVGGYDPQYDGVSQDCRGNTVSTGVVPIKDLEGCVVGSHIYMVDAFTGKLVWSIGTVDPGLSGDIFVKCDDSNADDSEPGSCHDKMGHGFVATPTSIDLDIDGAIDTLFTSDISGQIWRIDLRAATGDLSSTRVIEQATAGVIADLSRHDNSSKERFFYTNLDASILLGSDIDGSDTSTKSRINLAIGSGNRANPRSDAPSGGNRLFVVFDTNVNYPPSDYDYVAPAGGGSMLSTVDLSDLPVFDASSATPTDFADLQHGFQLKLSDNDKEKIITDSITVGGVVHGVSYSPEFGEGCSIGGGKRYSLDLTNGALASHDLKQPGIVASPVVLTLRNKAGTEDDPSDDSTTRVICFGTECLTDGGGGGGDDDEPGDSVGESKRKAWWEIFSD